MRSFSQFACIDWSGAVSHRPAGIALATIGEEGSPSLHAKTPHWSRRDILDWLLEQAERQSDILIGMDLSFGFPFADEGCFFPQWSGAPDNAKELWAFVDNICADDPHMAANSFLSHPQGHRHFRHAKGDVGDLFTGGIGRLRRVESHQRESKQANSWSCFNLVGAGQVGKGSLTGMRLLNQLAGVIPIWPFDPLPDKGPALAEIYTSIAARAAGMPSGRSKIRDAEALSAALAALDCRPSHDLPYLKEDIDDHAADALITATWMRCASQDVNLWQPKLLCEQIRQTEGWTFGVI